MDYDEEQLYTITLTKKQMLLIANCVEDCSRFLAGQCELGFTTCGLDKQQEIQEKLRELHDLVATDLANQPYASYGWSGGGCSNDYQRNKIIQLYPLYREILHFIAKEEGRNSVYAGSTPTCDEQDPFIKINKL